MSLSRTFAVAVAIVVATIAWAFTAPAGAAENPDYTEVAPTVVVSTPPPARPAATSKVEAANVEAANVDRTQLAITGSDVAGLAVIGAGLAAAGAGMLVIRRRRDALA